MMPFPGYLVSPRPSVSLEIRDIRDIRDIRTSHPMGGIEPGTHLGSLAIAMLERRRVYKLAMARARQLFVNPPPASASTPTRSEDPGTAGTAPPHGQRLPWLSDAEREQLLELQFYMRRRMPRNGLRLLPDIHTHLHEE